MPSWDGNNYNRRIHLPEFLAKLNPEALQEYGAKKKDKSFMMNYNYSSYDKDILAIRADKKAIPYPSLHTTTDIVTTDPLSDTTIRTEF